MSSINLRLIFITALVLQYSSAKVSQGQLKNARHLFDMLFCETHVGMVSNLTEFQSFTSKYPITGITDDDFEIFVKFLNKMLNNKISSPNEVNEHAANFATIFYALMNGGNQFAEMSYTAFSDFRTSLGWCESQEYRQLIFRSIVFSDCQASINSAMTGEAFNAFTTRNAKLLFTIPGGKMWTSEDFYNLFQANGC